MTIGISKESLESHLKRISLQFDYDPNDRMIMMLKQLIMECTELDPWMPIDENTPEELNNERGTGRTTNQIKNAPRNSVYIWLNPNLTYPKILSQKLGRDDLRIESPSFLSNYRLKGMNSDIVLDHATRLSGEQYDCLYEYLALRRIP